MHTATKQKARTGAAADYRGPARAGYALVVLSFGVLGGWALLAPPDSILAAADPVEAEPPRVVARAEVRLDTEIVAKPADPVSEPGALPKTLPRVEPIAAPSSDADASAQAAPVHELPIERPAEPESAPKAEPASERTAAARPSIAAAEEPRSSEQATPAPMPTRSAGGSSPAFAGRSLKQPVKAAQPRRTAKVTASVPQQARRLPTSGVTILIGSSGCGG
jgi:hypothetical protein